MLETNLQKNLDLRSMLIILIFYAVFLTISKCAGFQL